MTSGSPTTAADRPSRTAQQVGELGVARCQAATGVHDKQDHLRILDRRPRLGLDGACQLVRVGQVHTARVDEVEAEAVPLAFEGAPVFS